MAEYFVRELELTNCELEIYQEFEGDVGCVVWDAAITLAKYIDLQQLAQKFNFKGKRVIELGAGTGMVGLVAGAQGANVTITDLPQFVPLIQKNISHNAEILKGGNITAAQLIWGEDLGKFHEKYDIILMADLIYYEKDKWYIGSLFATMLPRHMQSSYHNQSKSIQPLAQTMVALSSSGTTILMSYEERTSGNKPELQRKFFELLERHFVANKIPLEDQDPVYRSEDIHIYKMRLK